MFCTDSKFSQRNSQGIKNGTKINIYFQKVANEEINQEQCVCQMAPE